MTYRICGVIVAQTEHTALSAMRDTGTCLYCGRVGLSNRYGAARRHARACGRNRTYHQIERCLAERLDEARGGN